MTKLRVYSINFQYGAEDEVSKVVISFGLVNTGGSDTSVSGSVELSADEYNAKGDTEKKVKDKLVAMLQEEIAA